MNKTLATIGILGAVALGGVILGVDKDEISKTKLTEKYNASVEVKAKYQMNEATLVKTDIKNAEKDKYKGEPKDEIKVTLGDVNSQEFTPDIELKRWNETSFKLKPKGLETVATKDKDLLFEGDKIRFKTPKMDFEMYDIPATVDDEGGFKYVWILNEPPATNKIEFEIESVGLDFFYQPELTAEEIDEGASRPENVVGSYAVYHSTKGGMNDINGKEYKVGKAFHIYRPHIIDALGKETWGILHIENGIYSVEIPQDFLDIAVYPIKSNDTIGFTSIGANPLQYESANIHAGQKVTAGSGGTLSKIQIAASDSLSTTITQTANPAGVSASSNVATYTNAAIGTASADRIIVVLVGSELTSASINSVTLGGSAMTAGTQGNFNGVYARAFYLAYPTGTTATVAVTFGANPSNTQNHIAVYSVKGATFSSTGADGSTDMDATDPLTTGSTSIDILGGMIAVAAGATDTVGKTWANLTENIDADAGAFRFTTAFSTSSGTATRTCTGGTNGEDGALSWLIFTPAGGNNKVRLAIYDDSGDDPNALIANSDSGELTITRIAQPTQDSEWTSSTSVSGTIVNGTSYWLAWHVNADLTYIYYDWVENVSRYKIDTYANFPPATFPSIPTDFSIKASIYATYTPSGGGEEPTPTQDIIWFYED